MSKNDSSSKKSELDKEYHFIQVEHMFLSRNETRLFIRKCGYEGLGIYFALAARSAPTGGVLVRKEFDDFQTFEEELAFLLELPAEKIETVKKVLRVAANQGLIKLEAIDGQADGNAFSFPSFQTKGMEQVAFQHLAESTPRVRKSRKNKKETAAAAEGEESEDHIRRNEELLQCNAKPLHCSDISESETKQHSQIHIESEKNNNNISFLNSVYVSDNGLFDKQTIAANLERFGDGNAGTGRAAETAPVPAAALTLDDWREISKVGKVELNEDGLEAYYKETLTGKWFNQEIPLKGLRGWAKKFRKKHPEWFSSTPGDGDADQDQGDTEPDAKPIWTQDDAWNHGQGKIAFNEILKEARESYTDDDLCDFVSEALEALHYSQGWNLDEREIIDALKSDGAWGNSRYSDKCLETAKRCVEHRQVMRYMMKKESVEPKAISIMLIGYFWNSILKSNCNFFDDEKEEFYNFFCDHRRNG